MLWGLLCRASNGDETVYILNNLQGSIDSSKILKYDARTYIIKTLKDFVQKNNDIDAVLMQDQNFNTISLREGQKNVFIKKKQYRLEKMTRLDLSIHRDGIVDEDSFYLID
jgi:hypothetical protein